MGVSSSQAFKRALAKTRVPVGAPPVVGGVLTYGILNVRPHRPDTKCYGMLASWTSSADTAKRSTPSQMNLQELRSHLPVTQGAIYMNSGWAGPTPLPVLHRIQEALKQEARLGPASTQGVASTRKVMEEARQAISTLVGADVDEICLAHSTREGVNIVIHGIAWKHDDELVICNLEHPALTDPAEVLAQRHGVKVRRAIISPMAPKGDILREIKAQLSPRTRLLALSHVQFACGLRMPIKEIGQLAQQAGVPFLVDGAQGAGHVEVKVADLGCDFYTISGQKWLMGPVGTGALYIRKGQERLLEPLFTTNALEAARVNSRSPVDRFSLTSQSPGLMAGFAEAVRMVQGIGMERIEQHVMALSNGFRRSLANIKRCRVLSSQLPEAACGLVTVGLEGWPPEELATVLQEQYRIVARTVHGPDGVRFSIAGFNTEQETDQVAEVLAKLAKERG